VQTVVFTLEPPAERTEKKVRVYPYAMFIFDSTSREPQAVFKVTPDLDSRTLTIESLMSGQQSISKMSSCVAAELEAAHASADRQMRPKDNFCNPDGYSYILCGCVEFMPAHYDEDCLDQCLAVCQTYNCLLCYPACWVPEYCIDYRCTTILPCP
jgi:hypothetical protein